MIFDVLCFYMFFTYDFKLSRFVLLESRDMDKMVHRLKHMSILDSLLPIVMQVS
jgi:hypothetical protein